MIDRGNMVIGRSCRMWRQHNIGRARLLHPVNVLSLVLLLGLAAWPAAAHAADEADEAVARQAYRVAEVWLEQREVPTSPSVSVEAEGVFALHVTLRREGGRIGQGTAAIDDPESPESATDLMPLLSSALRAALREAASQLEDPSELAEGASEYTLDVQFAYGLEPLELEQLEQLPDRLVQGLQGLAMQRGENWAWRFPASTLARNTGLSGQINRLLAELDFPLDRLAVVGTEEGPPLHRFEVIHLVRPRLGDDLLSLHRGNRLLPAVPLDDADLRSLTDQLLEHLLGRDRGEGRLAGTYQPTADAYSPSSASPLDAATTAYALARTAGLERLDSSEQDAAAGLALAALRRITADADAETEQEVSDDLATAAMTLIALLETPGAGELRDYRDQLADAVLDRHDGQGGFVEEEDQPASIATHALAAAALVGHYDRTREEDVLSQAHLALDALWQRLDDPRRATDAMPWLVRAELDLDRLGHPSGYRSRLVQTATQIWREQVQPWQEEAERTPDVVGGFAMSNALIREPGWQSARVLAGQAMMLHDPTLIDPDQHSGWLVQTALGARFLKQLTMQPASAFYARSAERAVGGTRTALWNNRQPIAATAMSLIATAEIEHALDRLDEN